jgi:hypothetical protein
MLSGGRSKLRRGSSFLRMKASKLRRGSSFLRMKASKLGGASCGARRGRSAEVRRGEYKA